MSVFGYRGGMPRVLAEQTAVPRSVAYATLDLVPSGVIMDGVKTRDPGNDTIKALRAGLLLGKVTSGGKYANSVIDVLNGAYNGTGTTLTLLAAGVTELVRRVGASGNLTLTGPPTAAGVVRSLTVAYSAASGTTVTITAASVNEVQTLTPTTAATAGTFILRMKQPNGTIGETGPIAYNASVATIQTALDLASGVANGVVLTTAGAVPPVSTPAAMVFTFSGTGYAGLPAPDRIIMDPSGLTGETQAPSVVTTAGVDGRFVTGSFVGDTDGSQIPRTFITTGWGEFVDPDSDGSDCPLPYTPMRGPLDGSTLINYPADTSLRQWMRDQLNTWAKFVFTEQF